jgi:decaprenylphospho-beta-D-erythro-pentofuranosid-2-ulose 2-reductase
VTGQPQRIVILGAGSAIAEATARIWAGEGARFVLVGRDAARLDCIAADLKTRGASDATPWLLDCAVRDSPAYLVQIVQALGGLDVLLLAYGALKDQSQLERDPEAVAELIETNFTSAVAWCLSTASVLERQRAGALLVIGSVAGDMGDGDPTSFMARRKEVLVVRLRDWRISSRRLAHARSSSSRVSSRHQ